MKALLVSFLSLVSSLWSSPVNGPVRGVASWYGESYRGKTMANGKPFNPDALTCASWNWPLGTVLSVVYKDRIGRTRSVVVIVTDRGPDKRLKRVIDLSSRAFRLLAGNLEIGVVDVDVTALGTESK